MNHWIDGPASPCFAPLAFHGNVRLEDLTSDSRLTEDLRKAAEAIPHGSCVMWGMPFDIQQEPVLVADQPVAVNIEPVQAGWLVFVHTSDRQPLPNNSSGMTSPMRGEGRLNEHAADYVVIYEDGSEERFAVRRRHQVGSFQTRWGENCFQAVAGRKPHAVRGAQEQLQPDWGGTQTRAINPDRGKWIQWLFAWENPHPEKAIHGLRFEPVKAEGGALVVSAVSAGTVSEQPLRWRTRRKALLSLPDGTPFQPDLDANGQLGQIQLDMGTVISAQKRLVYPQEGWEDSYNNQLPQQCEDEILIEYTAHPDACFHFWDGRVIPVGQVENEEEDPEDIPLQAAASSRQRVRLKVVEKGSQKPVAVRLHVHGAWGEYLAPVDRHRILNADWFEDYSADFTHLSTHPSTYINGDTVIDLPLGKVYIEVSKGFEVRPVRKVVMVAADTEELTVEVEKVLPWRERGWVTADTHVHFLSPGTALLEGAGEGVNMVNLLASQWGELMTNVGDFDGQTTWGERRLPGASRYGKPPACVGAYLAAGLLRADDRSHDHRRTRRIGSGRSGGYFADRMGAPVPEAGRAGGTAAFPQSTGRTCRQHCQRRDRCARDDLLAGSLQRDQPVQPGRLVPLSQLRLPGGGSGGHR